MSAQISPAEVIKIGEEVYRRDIKSLVETDPANHAKMLVLDINTGQYKISSDVLQAAIKLKERLPNAEPFTIRVGFPTAFRIGDGADRG